MRALLFAFPVLLCARAASARPGPTLLPPAPAHEDMVDEWNAPMFTTGVLVFGASYGAAAVVAASSDHVGDGRLWVPVVGPWLDLAERETCPVEMSACAVPSSSKVLLLADGVFQAAGVLAMLDGALQPVHHHRSALEARRAYRTRIVPASLGREAPGFVVKGHF